MSVKQGGSIFDFGNSSVPSTSVYTLCGFFWHDGSTGHNFGYFDMSMGAAANGNIIYHPDTASATRVALANITAGDFDFSQPMQPRRWMFVAYVQRGTGDYTAYIKPVGQRGFTPAQRNKQTATTIAIDRFDAGCIQFASGDPFPGYVSHLKFWNGRALSEAQLDIESQQLRPAHAGVYSYVPLYNGLRDMSGQGHHYTTDGTNTFPQFEPPLPLTLESAAVSSLLMRSFATIAGLAGRLNARMENFWLRGQTWDSFWIDGDGFEAGGTTFFQTVSGTLTSAGALVLRTGKVLTGSMASAGALLRQTGKALAGTMTSAGALLRQARKILSGTLTSSGALAAAKVSLLSLTGTLTSSGTLVRETRKLLTGTLTSAGALVKETRKAFTGSMASSGTLTTIKVVLRAVTGSMASAGALSMRTGKALAGTLTSAGALVKETRKVLTGAMASSGALATVKAVLRSVSGSMASAGSLVLRTGKQLAGTLGSSGALVRQARHLLSGTLTSAGTLSTSRLTLRSVSGAVSFAGALVPEGLINLARWIGIQVDKLLRPRYSSAVGIVLRFSTSTAAALSLPVAGTVAARFSSAVDVAVSIPHVQGVQLAPLGG